MPGLFHGLHNTAVVLAGVAGFIVLVVLAVRIGGSAAGIEKGAGNPEAARALSEARKPLEEYLTAQGVKLPKARLPKGPRPKNS